ncbi:MAG: PcfB family protein [Lachnospiraceae bacterium]|nr:PcfB family protein [Lachnospiraceae bacterium]
MPSLTDDLMGNMPENVKKGANAALKAGREVVKGAGNISNEIKGLCVILLKGLDFTTENVVNAVKDVAFKASKDVKYSSRNISVDQLKKSGKVFKVDDMVSGDVMKHFDAHCRKMGIKYSAMKDCRDDKPAYILFFQGNDSDLILQAMQSGCRDFDREKAGALDKGKQEQRESVKAKLAFFRDRVAARDKSREVVEKQKNLAEMSR